VITAGNGYPLIENPRVLMLQNPPFAELQSQLSRVANDSCDQSSAKGGF
ncbi:MAG: hypothetical protein EZS28_050199, partial [Streblomastix strix]